MALRLASALRGENLRLRAMGLTYLSLFALVPALVVVFLVVRAFTGTDRIGAVVHEFLLENLAVGARASLEPYLYRFVHNAHATSAGLVGGALLVYSAVGLFSHVERAVNDIWSIRRSRPLRQQLPIYWAGLTLGPLLLADSAAMSQKAAGWVGHLGAALGSVLLTCAFFTFLYVVIPATRVRLLPASIGGAVAGVSWEIARVAYAWFAGRFFKFHAVYGSLAFFPIFVTWLYVSWTLVLFGARVAFVAQNARAHIRGHPLSPTPRALTVLTAQVMFEVALAFDQRTAPPDPSDITARFPDPGESVRQSLSLLRDCGLVVDLAGGGLAPGRSLRSITLAEITQLVVGVFPEVQGGSDALIVGLLGSAEELAQSALSKVSYADLCQRWRSLQEAAGQRPEST